MDFNSVLTMAFKPAISKRNTDFNLSKKRYLPDQNKKGVYLRNVSLFTAFMAFKHSNISLTIFYDELIVTAYYQRFRFISDNFLTSFYQFPTFLADQRAETLPSIETHVFFPKQLSFNWTRGHFLRQLSFRVYTVLCVFLFLVFESHIIVIFCWKTSNFELNFVTQGEFKHQRFSRVFVQLLTRKGDSFVRKFFSEVPSATQLALDLRSATDLD